MAKALTTLTAVGFLIVVALPPLVTEIVGALTVPCGVYVAAPLVAGLTSKPVTFVPVKVGLETVPVAVPVTLTVPAVPVKLAEVGTGMLPVTKRTPVPVNELEAAVTLPLAVPEILKVAGVPVKLNLSF